MIFVILETLIVKGAITIGHWIAAHGTGAMATKAGTMIAKSIATQGLANTLAGVTGVAIGSSLVVGSIVWTTGKIQALGEGLDALYARDYTKAAQKFANLASLLHVEIEFLPDVIQDLLEEKAGFSSEDASNVAEAVRSLEGDILNFATTRY